MFRLKISGLAAILLAVTGLPLVCTAQMSSRSQKVEVLRVGSRLACQCGCSDTVATCSMLSCSFSHPAKEKIAAMQGAGSSDQTIIDDFVKEYGQGIYRGEPAAFGWIIPYLALAGGLAVVIWYVRRLRRPKPAVAFDSRLAHYNEQVEKELADLDQ